MNRFQYWLRARTRYNLHSPFLFDLYDKVLWARLDGRPAAVPQCCRRDRRYHEMVYKMTDFFSMHVTESTADSTMLAGNGVVKKAIVVRRPHRSSTAERQWHTIADTSDCNIAIDLYDVGLLIQNPRLLPQRFLLR